MSDSNQIEITYSKKNEKLESILNTAKELFVETTSHGIPHIIRSKSLLIKLVWLIFFLISTGLCAYLISESVSDYLKFEVTTKTRILFDQKVPFPTVNICFKQKFSTSYALEILEKVIDENNMLNIFDETVYNEISYKEIQKLITDTKLKANIELLKMNLTSERKQMLSFSMNQSLIGCNFNAKSDICTSNDFNWKYDYIYGNCFLFNAGLDQNGQFNARFLDSIIPGKTNGLQITMYLNIIEKLRILSQSYGLYINVDYGENNGFSNMIEISAGYETNIAVNREFVQQYPTPYSNCELSDNLPKNFDSKLYKMFPGLGINYKQSVCFELCHQTILKEHCNCTNDDFYSFYNIQNCYSKADMDCLNIIMDKYIYEDFFEKECAPLCPLECNQTIYHLTISATKLNLNYFANFLKEQNLTALTVEDQKNHLIKFNIYFDSFSYKLITETPSLNIVELFSNIGGTLGLFLGVSFLTCVELVDFLIQVCFILFPKLNKVSPVVVSARIETDMNETVKTQL